MKPYFLVAIISLSISLHACNGSGSSTLDTLSKDNLADKEIPEQSPTAGSPSNPSQQIAQVPGNVDWSHKIVRTGNIEIRSNNVNEYTKKVMNSVRTFGAYVASQKDEGTGESRRQRMTIKVPVLQFEGLLLAITDGEQVVAREITSDDVTTQIIDTRSRIEARKESRDRYLQLVKQAKTMKDIVELERQIGIVQEEIEAGAARVNALSHTSAFSTIELLFYQEIETVAPPKPGYLSEAASAFRMGVDFLGEVFLLVIAVWPLWIALVFAVLLVRRYTAVNSTRKNGTP